MTKLKRCPCCHSDDIGPSFSFPTEDDSAGITIRCGNCGLMLTPVEHPTDDDGDLYDEDSDYVEEVLDDIAYDWNKRAKDSNIDSFVLLGKEILDQIDKYANKVHGVEQIRQVDLLRKRIKELKEIHNKELKENLVKAVHDTGSRITQDRHSERVTETLSPEPAHSDGDQRPIGVYFGEMVGQLSTAIGGRRDDACCDSAPGCSG